MATAIKIPEINCLKKLLPELKSQLKTLKYLWFVTDVMVSEKLKFKESLMIYIDTTAANNRKNV